MLKTKRTTHTFRSLILKDIDFILVHSKHKSRQQEYLACWFSFLWIFSPVLMNYLSLSCLMYLFKWWSLVNNSSILTAHNTRALITPDLSEQGHWLVESVLCRMSLVETSHFRRQDTSGLCNIYLYVIIQLHNLIQC